MSRRHIMVIAGEPSGDLHGAGLIKELLKKDPCLKITGIGGDLMEQQGMTLFYHIRDLSVMGVTEVLRQFGQIKKAFDLFRYRISADKPHMLILIDYPGFNLKAAACAKSRSIPVLYYVLPKVWAWKKSRIKKIRQYVDHAALIFPFEEQLFKKEKIPCTFVGNPLLDHHFCPGADAGAIPLSLSLQTTPEEKSAPDPALPPAMEPGAKNRKKGNGELIVGVLPGSRLSEISTLLKIMLKSCCMIRQKYQNITFLVSASSSIQNTPENASVFNEIMAEYDQDGTFHIVPGSPRELFFRCDLILAASGTVTLEAAIWAVPMIITYKVSPITYFLARRFVTIPHVGLPNIVAGYEVVPELIQENATPENISRKAIAMLTDPSALDLIRKRLLMLRTRLSGAGASMRTARIAMQMLKKIPEK